MKKSSLAPPQRHDHASAPPDDARPQPGCAPLCPHGPHRPKSARPAAMSAVEPTHSLIIAHDVAEAPPPETAMLDANQLIDIHRMIDSANVGRMIDEDFPTAHRIPRQPVHRALHVLRDPTEQWTALASDALRSTTDKAAARNDRPARRFRSSAARCAPAQRR